MSHLPPGLVRLDRRELPVEALHGAYLFFAAMATPLVFSVHSVVSWDFAMALNPGWHSTMFAPYFVAGAIFSGVAMVINLIIPIRKIFKLEHIVTIDHMEKLAKLVLLTSCMVGYSYLTEIFIAWFGPNKFERDLFHYRAFGELLVGVLDHDELQRHLPDAAVVQAAAPQHDLHVHPVHLRQRRHVVRALHHHRHVAGALVQPLGVDALPHVVHRGHADRRLVRLVLHVLPHLHQGAARVLDRRDQGNAAGAAAEEAVMMQMIQNL